METSLVTFSVSFFRELHQNGTTTEKHWLEIFYQHLSKWKNNLIVSSLMYR